MALRIDDLERWVARKKAEVRDAEPLSIQANISVLSARLWAAEQQLEQVQRLHRDDYCTRKGYCVHCHRPWPCPTARIVGGAE